MKKANFLVILLIATISTLVACGDNSNPSEDDLGGNDDGGSCTGCPDLMLVKTAVLTAVPAGTPITYTLRYGNNGNQSQGPATGVTIVDDYDEVNLDPATLDLPHGCTDSNPAGTITCSVADLPQGLGRQKFVYTIYIAGGVLPGTQISNTAIISATEEEANPTNNTSTEVVTVSNNAPDLTLVKNAKGIAGSTIIYVLTYGNDGTFVSEDATGVTITDDYDETRLVNLNLPDGCIDNTPVTGKFTCTIGDVAQGVTGQKIQYTADIGVAMAPNTHIPNIARITANEADVNTDDNMFLVEIIMIVSP